MRTMRMIFSMLVISCVQCSGLCRAAEAPGEYRLIRKAPRTIRVGVLPYRLHGKLPRAVAPPFDLSCEESDKIDAILLAWQQASRDRSKDVQHFVQYYYDTVFGTEWEPVDTVTGDLSVSSPRCGLYQVEDGTVAMNGDSVILNGRTIDAAVDDSWLPCFRNLSLHTATGSLLPFLFAVQDGTLRERCYVRRISPSRVVNQEEVWLEVIPRYEPDTSMFQRLQVILISPHMTLKAAKLEMPDGHHSLVYVFDETIPEPSGCP